MSLQNYERSSSTCSTAVGFSIRPREAAGHAAAVVFARKPDGAWLNCYDYRGLNTITRLAVELLPHIDALLDGTRGTRFSMKLDLAISYHQLRVLTADRWKTRFRW